MGAICFRLHGHTYQAHPLASAASLAVQRVIASESLLERLLKDGLQGSNAHAAPHIADIRGGGLFWGVEFVIPGEELPRIDAAYQRSTGAGDEVSRNRRFGLVLQDKTMDRGLVVVAMAGSVDGARGDHAILAPAYNVTSEEIQKIVDLLIESVEELL
ncbi:hypothetical protein FRC10_001566, partial [Ceratobasidium sp. 414]